MNKTLKRNRIISLILVFTFIFLNVPFFIEPARAQMSFDQLTDVNIISVSAGSYHQLALDDQGNVWAWGENVNGKQGLGTGVGTHLDPRMVMQTSAGSPLPPVKQISASYQNSLLLDVYGNVWSAGAGDGYANGNNSISAANYFTNVNIGGKKAVYVSSGEYSGMAVDEDGHLWFWGRSRYNSNGLSNTNASVPAPVMIQTGTTNIGTAADAANNIDISDIKFAAVEVSDWQDTHGGAAIALTESGDIWTWGIGAQNDAVMLASGGSYRPKKVTAADISSSIKTLPESIAKIDAGVGAFSLLDTDGNLWTWGANAALFGQGGMLGHGMTGLNDINNRVKAPKKVDYIKISSGAAQTAAPKFRDYGFFAWNIHTVDTDGNIYAVGELNYGTDIGAGSSKNILTKGNLPASAKAAKIVKTSGGHFGAVLFIDINGNVWQSGTYAGGTALTPADFPRTKGLFTSLETDVNGIVYKSHYLDGTPVERVQKSGATLTAKVSAGTGYTVKEVQYIKLYDDDPYYDLIYKHIRNGTGKETAPGFMIDKTVINGTDTLVSESYPYFSQYVTELFSESVFNEAYASANLTTTRESGLMNPTGTTGTYTLTADDNYIVVLQSVTYKNGSPSVLFTNRTSHEFNCFYTPIRIYSKGVKYEYEGVPFDKNNVEFQKDPDFNYNLYSEKSYTGADIPLYGLYYTHDGKVSENPPYGFDKIIIAPKDVPYWQLSPSEEIQAKEIILDSEAYQESLSRASGEPYFFDESTGLMYYRNPADNQYYVLITYTYEKDASWVPVTIHYVDDNLSRIDVHGSSNPELIGSFSPEGVPFREGNTDFIPPAPVDANIQAIGYIKTPSGESPDIDNLVLCSFPDGFNPILSSGDEIYIVYKSGVLSVTEHFLLDSKDGTAIDKPSVVQIEAGGNYGVYSAPEIKGYVAVEAWREKSEQLGGLNGEYGSAVTIFIENIQEPMNVYFVYKRDANDNGIPDDYEGSLNVRWVGVYEDGRQETLNSHVYIGDGKKSPPDAKVFAEHEGEAHGAGQIAGGKSWIFNQPATVKTWNDGNNPDFPAFPVIYEYKMGVKDAVLTFYYDADMNGNGVADKDEGHIEERYRDINGAILQDKSGNLLVNDSRDKKIEGENYEKKAPDISGYVAVQVKIDSYVNQTELDISSPRQNTNTAFISSVGKYGHIVTFFYMRDENNNGIPDDYEGKITVQWIGLTASGTEVVMREDVRYGVGKISEGEPLDDLFSYVDTGVVHAEEYLPSDQWILDTGEFDSPPRDVEAEYNYSGKWFIEYAFEHGNDKVLKFFYDEDYNRNDFPDRLEPVKITVTGKAGGTELYSYVVNKGFSDRPFDIQPFPEPTYKIKSSQVIQFTDENGTVISAGDITDAEGLIQKVIIPESENFPVTVDPKRGHQTVLFEYDTNMTNVTIEAYYGDGNGLTSVPVEGFVSFNVNAEIGKPFVYQALTIPNHTNTFPADGIGKLDAVSESGDNVIKFYYTKNTGKLIVIAKESGTGEVIGNAAREISYGDTVSTADSNAPDALEIPVLANYELIADSGTVTPSGTDVYNGIGEVTLTYSYVKKTRDIKAEAYDSQTGQLIGAAASKKYSAGSTHDISAPSSAEIAELSGYTLIGDNVLTVYVSNSSADEIIVKFFYTPNAGGSVKVAAYWNDGTEDIEIQSYTIEYPLGKEVRINAPLLNGWTLAQTPPDNEESVIVTPSAAPQEVRFRYEKSAPPVIGTIDVTVNGVDDETGGILYSYVITRLKNSGSFEVKAFTLNGYELQGDEIVSTEAQESDETITFRYKNLSAKVTINAVISGTSEPVPGFSPIEVKAVTRQPFEYSAPFIFGYNLAGSISQSIASVDSYNNQLTFEYVRASGNVSVILKENDAYGKIIKVFNETLSVGETKTIEIPDLSAENYTIAAGQTAESVTYQGVAVIVDYYYVKDTRKAEILTYDVTDNENPVKINSYQIEGSYRIGETAVFNAPNENGYCLAGQPSATVLIEAGSGSQQIIFNYVQMKENDLIVTSIEETTNNILAATIIKAAEGSALTVYAPNVTGYKLTADESESKVSSVPGSVIFKYARTDNMTVTIHVVYMNVTDGEVLFEKDIVLDKNSGDVEIKAIPIEGFVLGSAKSVSVPTDGSVSEVIFEYSRVQDTNLTLQCLDENQKVINEYIIGGLAVGKIYRINTADFKINGYAYNFSEPSDVKGIIYFRTDENAGGNRIILHYKKEKANVVVNYIDINNLSAPFHAVSSHEDIGEPFFANTDIDSGYIFLRGIADIIVSQDEAKNIINLYYVSVSELLPKSVLVRHISQTPEFPSRTWIIETEIFTNLSEPAFVYDKENSETVQRIFEMGYGESSESFLPENLEVDLINAPEITYIQLVYEPMLHPYEIRHINSAEDILLETVDAEGYIGTPLPNPDIKTFDSLKFMTFEKQSEIITKDTSVVKVLYEEPPIAKVTVRFIDEASKKTIDTAEFTKPAGEVFTFIPDAKIIKSGTAYILSPESYKGINELVSGDETLNVWDVFYRKEPVVHPGGGGGISPDITPPPETTAEQDTTEEPTAVTETPSEFHTAYIHGYPDGTVRPDGLLTRAEAAQILFNLSVDPNKSNAVKSRFTDVKDGAWYSHSVNYMAGKGVLTGYADGAFRPEAFISRAEYTAMAVRFYYMSEPEFGKFPDIPMYWAARYIYTAYQNGWVQGYPDGDFKPEAKITRAEAVTIINKMLGRPETGVEFTDGGNPYSDITSSHWAFRAIMEASLDHEHINERFTRAGTRFFSKKLRKKH